MKEPEELQIQAEMEEISKNIDRILQKIEHLDPGKLDNLSQHEDS
jgi:hypothetical protein